MLKLTQKENIESFVSNNIEALEEILNERAKRYLEIHQQKEKYDFGPTLTPEKLGELAGKTIKEVNDFLKISNTTSTRISMFYLPNDLKYAARVTLGVFTVGTLIELTNGLTTTDLELAGKMALLFGGGMLIYNFRDHLSTVFDRYGKTIRISERKTVPAVGGIAHEYTHQLQDATQLANQIRNPVMEGHARGIEGVITNIFAQRYDNPAYAFDHTDRTAKELNDAYLFVCRKKGISPNAFLANLPIPPVRNWWYNLSGHHYSLGVAAMSIAEKKQGDMIYPEILRNNFSFFGIT